MEDDVDELLVEVRASTSGFQNDIAQMRSSFDSVLGDGFGKAGDVLERGLMGALRKGSLGFEDLRRIATQVLDQIAGQALQLGFDKLFGGLPGGTDGGLGSLLGSALSGIFGLPGRATGGPVSPGRGYLVGERGPELFIPASAGRVESGTPSNGRTRDVQVSIQLAQPRGISAPTALRRSSRQIASAVRKTLMTS